MGIAVAIESKRRPTVGGMSAGRTWFNTSVLNAIVRQSTGERLASSEGLIDAVFGDRSDGGPLSAEGQVRIAISELRGVGVDVRHVHRYHLRGRRRPYMKSRLQTAVLEILRRGYADRDGLAFAIGTTPDAVGVAVLKLRRLGVLIDHETGYRIEWASIDAMSSDERIAA